MYIKLIEFYIENIKIGRFCKIYNLKLHRLKEEQFKKSYNLRLYIKWRKNI